MDKRLINRIEELINKYKKDHKGQSPFYIILSPDDGEALTEEVRALNKQPEGDIITLYKDMKIVKHMALLDGEYYVSNDLPETSS